MKVLRSSGTPHYDPRRHSSWTKCAGQWLVNYSTSSNVMTFGLLWPVGQIFAVADFSFLIFFCGPATKGGGDSWMQIQFYWIWSRPFQTKPFFNIIISQAAEETSQAFVRSGPPTNSSMGFHETYNWYSAKLSWFFMGNLAGVPNIFRACGYVWNSDTMKLHSHSVQTEPWS